MDWDKALNNTIKFLDSIDLAPYINEYKGGRLYDLMDKLELDFKFKDEYSESLFDCMSENEFIHYLNKKYKCRCEEVCFWVLPSFWA
jgi:hypothetical protein